MKKRFRFPSRSQAQSYRQAVVKFNRQSPVARYQGTRRVGGSVLTSLKTMLFGWKK